jgi:hypothetical protein
MDMKILAVCSVCERRPARHDVGQRARASVAKIIALMLVAAACSVSVYADEYDIIIEKNLFHDQRQKWEMERPQSKGDAAAGPGAQDQRDIAEINLFGTVIKDSQSYAVMRVTPQKTPGQRFRRPVRRPRSKRLAALRNQKGSEQNQDSNHPYAVGDFIGGFQILEIRPGSVLLQDMYDNNRYEVFMNDGKTERTAVRTEIPEEKPPAPERPQSRRPQRKSRPGAATRPTPDQAADFMRQRFERDMQVLRDTNDPAAAEQALRDWDKIEPMLSSIDDSGREDLLRLKEEFERMQGQ